MWGHGIMRTDLPHTDVFLNDEVVLRPALYPSEYVLQVMRYADSSAAAEFTWFQDPNISHSVQFILRIDLLQLRQSQFCRFEVFLRNMICNMV